MKKLMSKRAAGAVLAVMLAGSSMTAWAGEWIQLDNGSWMYENEGGYACGWQQIGGYWYYLDDATGIWNPSPAITDEAAARLLGNALKKAGLYQDEGADVICRVDSSNENYVYLSVGTEKSPNYFSILNTFTVNRKTGRAESGYSKDKFNLWE